MCVSMCVCVYIYIKSAMLLLGVHKTPCGPSAYGRQRAVVCLAASEDKHAGIDTERKKKIHTSTPT